MAFGPWTHLANFRPRINKLLPTTISIEIGLWTYWLASVPLATSCSCTCGTSRPVLLPRGPMSICSYLSQCKPYQSHSSNLTLLISSWPSNCQNRRLIKWCCTPWAVPHFPARSPITPTFSHSIPRPFPLSCNWMGKISLSIATKASNCKLWNTIMAL